MITSGSAENSICLASKWSAIFYSSSLFFAWIFLPGEVKKYNLAISVIFGGLKPKNCVLLISLMINSLYLPSVDKNSPVISNCCLLEWFIWNNMVRNIFWHFYFEIWVNKFILVCVNNNTFWQINLIISSATVKTRSFKCFLYNYFNCFFASQLKK